MKVISCFDGCAGAMQALKSLGIKVDEYYAFEIDKYAIQIAAANHPEISHLGSIEDWEAYDLYDQFENIDLIIGGSPCQDLSIAGKRKGLAGDRSGLFYTMADMIKQLKPKYFLVENVASMKSCQRDIISQELGVEPIMINSALVTAQNRKRLYWTNIPGTGQPIDRGIFLKDVIEDGVTTKTKSYCITASMMHGLDQKDLNQKQGKRQIVFSEKSQTIPATIYKENEKSMIKRNKKGLLVATVQKPRGNNPGGLRSIDGKTPTLTGSRWEQNNHLLKLDDLTVRKLTPLECERLQGFSDDYTKGVSNTQRYKMIGNGFTVPVIAHILKRV